MAMIRLVALALILASGGSAWSQQGSSAAPRPNWPGVGDRWVYEARDTNHPDRKYQLTVQVQEVGNSSIADLTRAQRGAQVSQTHEAGAHLMSIAPGVADFSPYLLAFQKLNGKEKWPKVAFEELWGCGRVEFIQCAASAEVVRRERVSVPAGTFEAWKIEVSLRLWMAGSATGYGTLTYWFAEEPGRMVKSRSQVQLEVGGHYSWPEPDMDVELLSHTPARATR